MINLFFFCVICFFFNNDNENTCVGYYDIRIGIKASYHACITSTLYQLLYLLYILYIVSTYL